MATDLIGVPVAADTLARALRRHTDYRVQKRLKPMTRLNSGSSVQGVLTGVALDVETTGLDLDACQVIELCVQRFRFDELGRIVEVGKPRAWLEWPGEPLSPTIRRLTGLNDSDLVGRVIADGEATCIIASADVVVAHNAAFDRPLVERRLPDASGKRWVCSMRDINWEEHGFNGRSLDSLLEGCGWFHEGHRAEADVNAVLHLLDHRLNTSGTVLRELVRTAARPTWRIAARGAPFAAKDFLKSRGYRWDGNAKHWWREVGPDDLDAELEWNRVFVYGPTGGPSYEEITWETRYARRRS